MFKAPEIEVIRFDVEDVITTSGEIGGDSEYGGAEEE